MLYMHTMVAWYIVMRCICIVGMNEYVITLEARAVCDLGLFAKRSMLVLMKSCTVVGCCCDIYGGWWHHQPNCTCFTIGHVARSS